MDNLVKEVRSLERVQGGDLPAELKESAEAQPVLYKEKQGLSAIEIHGWLIIVRKTHIAEDAAVEALADMLKFPPPEILFDKNLVAAVHLASGKALSFDTLNALRGVIGEPHGLKRPQLKLKRKPTASKPAKEIDVQIDFDWTYTSAFSGAFMSLEEAKERQGVSVEWTSKTIDYEILKRREPILFYTSLSLYEDELHDHGHTGYTVKLRVMPSCFYILARHFLRVDRSILRIIDTRVFFPFPAAGTTASRDFINMASEAGGPSQPLPEGASEATKAAQAVQTGVATAATWGTQEPVTSPHEESKEGNTSVPHTTVGPVTLLRETTVRETTFLKLAEEGKSTNPQQYLDPDRCSQDIPIISQYTQAIRI